MAVQHTLGRTGCFLLLMIAGVAPTFSQDTHRNVMVDIALECLQSAWPEPSTIQLAGSENAGIVTPGIERGLIAAGYTISSVDSEASSAEQHSSADQNPGANQVRTSGPIRLVYDVELAKVALERKGRNQLTRRVSLGLHFQVLGPAIDQQTPRIVINAGTCTDTKTDVIERTLAPDLAFDGFSATSPIIPPASRFRRFIQPVVLVAASAVGTYLFFNLRSRRADGG